jgi:hypothetical protein
MKVLFSTKGGSFPKNHVFECSRRSTRPLGISDFFAANITPAKTPGNFVVFEEECLFSPTA